jgi:hypothetical protein
VEGRGLGVREPLDGQQGVRVAATDAARADEGVVAALAVEVDAGLEADAVQRVAERGVADGPDEPSSCRTSRTGTVAGLTPCSVPVSDTIEATP